VALKNLVRPFQGRFLHLKIPWAASLRSSPTVIHIEPLRGSQTQATKTARNRNFPIRNIRVIAPRVIYPRTSTIFMPRSTILFAAALVLSLALAPVCAAQPAPASGAITGTIIDPATTKPVEFITVTLTRKTDSHPAAPTTATDSKGAFTFDKIPYGDYTITYAPIGAAASQTTPVTLDAQHRTQNLGKLPLANLATTTAPDSNIVQLDKLQVSARRQSFYNTIDRKVYDIGKDLQSAGGSASDLLQNVPSVQVDIEGNVALRGDTNVLILIDGKTSALMGANSRADVLAQMPADSIASIEVITNPSAKYKPDGTAGIINIKLKKQRATDTIYTGSVRVTIGNDSRYSAGVNAALTAGKLTLSANAALRNDFRPRTSQDDRTHPLVPGDPASNVTTSIHQQETSRPIMRIAGLNADYAFTPDTTAGAGVSYNNRTFDRYATLTTVTTSATGTIASDYDRKRYDPEYETELEFTANAKHNFGGDDEHTLDLELTHSKDNEQEDNHYTNIYRTPPATPDTLDAMRIRNIETLTEVKADYAQPFGETTKLETGYDGTFDLLDQNFFGSALDPATQLWTTDTTTTNHFVANTTVHAAYATLAHKFGDLGILAGLRYENARVRTDQRTSALVNTDTYNRLYPSLHLSYDLTPTQQLQANYSHRIHRPDPDDMNPYPEYQDPFNLRAGNPRLRPEEIHSIEAGYQYHTKDTTLFATAYYRYRYNGITDVSEYVDANFHPDTTGLILLTTKQNLSTSRYGGAELGAQARILTNLQLNLSGNLYRNVIDASNLGFSSNRSTTAWDAKLNLSYDATKTTLIQLNTNYTAKRLTAQGYRDPTFQANIGLRQFFLNKRLALIISVSDIFNSLRERTYIDTPILRETITRRRTSRIYNIGLIYNFGKPAKKPKDDLQFDNSGL